MPKEWVAGEDIGFWSSLFSLREEIHALVNCSRNADLRLNVRELIAPMMFEGVSSISERSIASMMEEVADARAHLSLLFQKLCLLSAELSVPVEGGVA